MKADMLLLKQSVNESNQSLTKTCKDIATDIQSVRDELHDCAIALTPNQDNTSGGTKQLSHGIKKLYTVVNKLENTKVYVLGKIGELCTSVRDNSSNIANMSDFKTSVTNDVKLRLNDMHERIDETCETLKSTCAKKGDLDGAIKTVNARIKTIEQNKHDEPTEMVLETALNRFSQEMTRQFDKLCCTLDASTLKLADKSNTVKGPSADYHQEYCQEMPINTSGTSSYKRQQSLQLAPSTQYTSQREKPVAPQPTAEARRNKSWQTAAAASHPDVFETDAQATVHSVVMQSSPRQRSDSYVQPKTGGLIQYGTDKRIAESANGLANNDLIHNERRFTGVLRKRVKVYVVTGIDLESTEEGLCDFLNDLNVQFKSAKFIYTRRTDCRVARVVVDANDSSIVEDENNWPEGIHCRSWLKVEDYRSRRRNLVDDQSSEQQPNV